MTGGGKQTIRFIIATGFAMDSLSIGHISSNMKYFSDCILSCLNWLDYEQLAG